VRPIITKSIKEESHNDGKTYSRSVITKERHSDGTYTTSIDHIKDCPHGNKCSDLLEKKEETFLSIFNRSIVGITGIIGIVVIVYLLRNSIVGIIGSLSISLIILLYSVFNNNRNNNRVNNY
jgi:hypothetical protein